MKIMVAVLMVLLSVLFQQGCDLDAKIDTDDFSDEVEIVNVDLVPLVSGLNYPTSVRIITSDDPYGTGTNSVLKRGNLLVTNAGISGSYANSVVQVNPRTGTISLFSDGDLLDLNGEQGIDRPVSVAFPTGYPWVANATYCYGSVAVLDASPGLGFDGPGSKPGEPVNGPLNHGIYGCGDFCLTALSVVPEKGQKDVSLYSTIVVRFSLPVEPSSVHDETFMVDLDEVDNPTGMDTYERGTIKGTYHFSSDLRTVTFIPAEPLVSSTVKELTVYEITLDDKIMDIFGNKFDGNLDTPDVYDEYLSTFSTERELVPPTIIAHYPGYWQETSTHSAVVLYFSEPIRQDSVDEHSFSLIKGDYADYQQWDEITGDKYYYNGNRIFSYIPDDVDWVEESIYHIRAAGTKPDGFPGITDRAGNGLDGDYDGQAGGTFWSAFYTHGNDTPPYVVFIAPYRGETNVPITSSVYVLFSEPLDSATITNETFQLWSGGTRIYGVVTRSNGYIEATFTPYNPLPYNARIDVVLLAAIQDTEGNPLDGNHDGVGGDNYYSHFFTMNDPENTPPQVASIVPPDNQSNVPVSSQVTVVFTKVINPTTVDPTSFFMQQGGTGVDATVEVLPGNTSARLVPTSQLAYQTTYTVTLTDAITDMGGRQLDGNYDGTAGGNFVSTFSTSADPSTIPPYVYSTYPAVGTTNADLDTNVVITFSEPMNTGTVAVYASFFLVESGGGPVVDGALGWDPTNTTVTFNPTGLLSEMTSYDLVLTTDIQDLDGFALDGDDPPDGTSGPDYVKAPFFATGATINIKLNEIMPDPGTDWDESGDYNYIDDEWIEIYNAGGGPVNLNGYYLTDSGGTPRFTFGNETLNAGQWRVVIAGLEFVNLSLNNTGGETVYLYDNLGGEVDSFIYSTSSDDRSWQRIPDGTGAWVQSLSCAAPGGGTSGCPTPGAMNYPATMGTPNASDYKKRLLPNAMNGAADYYPPLLFDNWGFGGITYGGQAPDTASSFNEQFFVSHGKFNDIYVFDYNTGFFPIGGYVPEFIEGPGQLVFVPDRDNDNKPLIAQGSLFIVIPQWDSIARFHLIPSGPVGQKNVVQSVDTTKAVDFYPRMKDPTNPTILNPIDIVYDQTSDHLFVANRANGFITEMDTSGNMLKIYKTNLGMTNLSSIDVGDWGEGPVIVLTTTGGLYINEANGPSGSLYYFKLE